MKDDKIFYKDKKGLWRWRLMSTNNKIIASASEGFVRRANARKNLRAIKKALKTLKF